MNRCLFMTSSAFALFYLRTDCDQHDYLNSHATKKFTPHNSSWSCRTKGIDFAILTRDRAMPDWSAIVYGQKLRNINPNSNFRFSFPMSPFSKINFRFEQISLKCAALNFKNVV